MDDAKTGVPSTSPPSTSPTSAMPPMLLSAPLSAPKDLSHLRIMTFNVRYGTAKEDDVQNEWAHRRSRLAECVLKHSPDIVGTQECLPFQAADIEKDLGGQYAYVGRDRDASGRSEMAAIFFRRSEFRDITSGTFWLSPTPYIPATKFWDSSLNRVVTWFRGTHAPSGRLLFLFNTHFDHFSYIARMESIKVLLNHTMALREDESKKPIVALIGDFNSPGEGSEEHRMVVGNGYRDLWNQVPPDRKTGPPGTFHAFCSVADAPKQRTRIDWILLRRDADVWIDRIETSTFCVGGKYFPSDHFPVVADLLV